MGHHHHVPTFPFHPTVEGKYPVLIVRVDRAETLPAQRGLLPPQRQQFAREPHVIQHLLIAGVETRPVEQQVFVKVQVVRPLFVLQELLSHEEHRNARRG